MPLISPLMPVPLSVKSSPPTIQRPAFYRPNVVAAAQPTVSEEEDFAQTLRSVAWELIPLFGPSSRRGLNPIKPVYDPDQPDGRLNLTASAFNQLGQYTSSPGRRGNCYAELAVFFPSSGRNHRQYSLRLPMEDGQAELAWVAGYVMR